MTSIRRRPSGNVLLWRIRRPDGGWRQRSCALGEYETLAAALEGVRDESDRLQADLDRAEAEHLERYGKRPPSYARCGAKRHLAFLRERLTALEAAQSELEGQT